MKPSSLRIRAISRFVREAGTTTSVWRAREALRILVSMSAMGSEMFIDFLPARLRNAGQLAQQGSLPEADPAQGEPTHVATRSAAHGAAVIGANAELRLALCLGDERLLGHLDSSPRLAGEGHAEELEQALRLLVGLRRRHDADLQPAETIHLVIIDLGECQLLAKPHREIAAPVEGLCGHSAEVADARQRQRRQSIEEFPHPLAAEGHLGPDRVARPDVELGDRAASPGDDWLLAGDHGQVAGRSLDRLGVLERLAEPDVDHDLVQTRDLHPVAILELLHERRGDLGRVALPQATRHQRLTSSRSPQLRQTRTRWPSSSVTCLIRVGWSQLPHTTITLPIGSGCAISRMPPCCTRGIRSDVELEARGLVWRLATFRPSTMTDTPDKGLTCRHVPPPRVLSLAMPCGLRMTRSTTPRLPASLPASTRTVSPFRTSGTLVPDLTWSAAMSEHLRGERYDLHV